MLLLALIVAVMGIALFARLRSDRGSGTIGPRQAEPAPAALATRVMTGADLPVPYLDSTIEVMRLAVYCRAFGTRDFDYAILGEHAAVQEQVRRSIPQAATRREYFPRKPQVVPRLLSAIKNSESSLEELVEIIMQDPVMTGNVLRYANSPFYRVSKEPVDSIGGAVVLLGMDGLRSLIATSVMQPIFQVPKGYFEGFSEAIWRQAQHSAVAAQAYARITRECDSFSAHLLALLFHMSHIVLFSMTVASYIEAAGSLPRAEVFARLIDECSEELASLIAIEWELPKPMISALVEHVRRCPIDQMTPLGRGLYFGRLCGAAVLASEEGALQDGEFVGLLQRKGLDETSAATLWRAIQVGDDPGK